MKRTIQYCALFYLLLFVHLQAQEMDNKNSEKGVRRIRQTDEMVMRKSEGCLSCHAGSEKMHKSPAVKLGCIDCHGGNPRTRVKENAHVQPRFPERWPSAANPIDPTRFSTMKARISSNLSIPAICVWRTKPVAPATATLS